MIHLPTFDEIMRYGVGVLGSIGIAKRQLANPQSGSSGGGVSDFGSLGIFQSQIRINPTAATTFTSFSANAIGFTVGTPGSGTPTVTVSGANTPGDVQFVGAASNSGWDGFTEGGAAANSFEGISLNFMKTWACWGGATQVGLNFGTFFGLVDFTNAITTTYGSGMSGVACVGFIIRPTDSNWQAMSSTGTASQQSYVNTGIAPILTQPQSFKMNFTTAGLMKYYIGGSQVAVINTNFPAASVKLRGMYLGYTASNSFNAKARFAGATWQWAAA